eukprot:CAMPEP_0116911744 /NCGR_PEP_ID=MMETSP0467-20121206/15668_1 /TAXON_ID=283647 /ORGANISM="Mesodinium pulex, Strain SPMC105" /LENGTH=79 /DNA_ID=CAMNT_0004587581 /DNA_START=230 /DNA_END=469 /DNA_ORIENTATION=+
METSIDDIISEEEDEANYEIPMHIVDPTFFEMTNDSDEPSDLRTILGVWNTMVGSGTFAVPYLFMQTGLIPGLMTLTLV